MDTEGPKGGFVTPKWIADEYERAKRRTDQLPSWARIHFSRPLK